MKHHLLFDSSVATFSNFTFFSIVEDTCFSQSDGDYNLFYHVTSTKQLFKKQKRYHEASVKCSSLQNAPISAKQIEFG